MSFNQTNFDFMLLQQMTKLCRKLQSINFHCSTYYPNTRSNIHGKALINDLQSQFGVLIFMSSLDSITFLELCVFFILIYVFYDIFGMTNIFSGVLNIINSTTSNYIRLNYVSVIISHKSTSASEPRISTSHLKPIKCSKTSNL